MREFISRFKGQIFVVTLVLFCVLILWAQSRESESRGPISGAVVDIAGGIERGMLAVTGTIDDVIFRYLLNVNAHKELSDSRREAMRATLLKSEVEELQRENDELRRLAAMAMQLDGPRGLSARVIGRTGAPLARILRIDRGSADGIRRGDGVMASGGVLGQIAATGRHTSDVLLMTDPGAAIDAVIQRTRARGIVQGSGSSNVYLSRVENFDRHADVEAGDVMVTSGIGTRFPPGLLIGTVQNTEVLADNLYLRAELVPAAKVDRVEFVNILIGRELERRPRLAPQESKDAESKEPSESKGLNHTGTSP